MDRFFFRLRLVFVSIFVVVCAASFAYSYFWRWPEQRCLANHNQWDWRQRVCAVPVIITDITRRPAQDPAAERRAREALAKPANAAP
jgi:hypothetical protein